MTFGATSYEVVAIGAEVADVGVSVASGRMVM
jgi:hypothetical protein